MNRRNLILILETLKNTENYFKKFSLSKSQTYQILNFSLKVSTHFLKLKHKRLEVKVER